MKASTIARSFGIAFATVTLAFPAHAAADYPTAEVVEYVYGCMKANGENREMLQRCSCSADIVTSIIPYDHYVTASTFKEMGMLPGEKGSFFRQSAPAKNAAAELKRAQAEADIRCFN